MLLTVMVGVLTLTAFGVSHVFANQSRQLQLRIDEAKAHYLAQAAVVRAAWNWYVSDTANDANRLYTHNSPGETVSGTTTHVLKFGYNGNEGSPGIIQSNFAYYASSSTPPIALVKNVATVTNGTNNTQAQVTVPAAGVAQGNFLIVYFAQDAVGTNPTCTDARGNTYTRHVNAAASNTTNHTRLAIFSAPVTTALVSGDWVRVNWTTNSAREAMTVAEFSGVTTVDQANSATGTATTGALTGSVTTTQANELIVGAYSVEGPTGDTWVKDASFSTAPPTRVGSGTGTSACTIDPMYRIVSATGSYQGSSQVDNNNSRDYSGGIATFYNAASDSVNWAGSNTQLRQWRLYNINSTAGAGGNITLTDVKVTWSPTNAATLTGISLGGTSVWSGSATSGTTVNITDTTLASDTSWGGTNTYLQWSANPTSTGSIAVTCQFVFSGDGSTLDARSHEVEMWNGSQAGSIPAHKTFTVTGTGEVTQTAGPNAFKTLKSVKVVISGAPGASALEIMDWDEQDKNIP